MNTSEQGLPRDPRAYLPWFPKQYVRNGGVVYWGIRTFATMLVFTLMIFVITNAFSLLQGRGITNPWGQQTIHVNLKAR